MDKEFIPYTEALALKELGFNENCFGFYGKDSKMLYKCYNNKGVVSYYILSPTFSQSFRFFRENLFHYAFLQPTSDSISENYCFKILDQYSGKFYSKSYVTYEEAELECLKKLIELTKGLNKKPKK